MRYWTKPRPNGRGTWTGCAHAALLLTGLAAGGCIVGEDRCGANQVLARDGRTTCDCVAGAVPDPRGYGCVVCGAHEVPVDRRCECEPGYARSSADAACEEVPGSKLGDACDAATPCTDPNPYCAEAEAAGFCTTSCSASSDCAAGWRCKKTQEASYCEKPVGLGDPCSMQSDCAGKEASYCETYVTSTCYLANCATGENACPNGNVCCDLTGLLGTSLCVTKAALRDGLCPGGKKPLAEGAEQ